jgi:hypothetical protein
LYKWFIASYVGVTGAKAKSPETAVGGFMGLIAGIAWLVVRW